MSNLAELTAIYSTFRDVSFWIPTADPPLVSVPTALTLKSVENVSDAERVFTFRIEGPPHMGVFLSPAENMKMVNWTYLNSQVPESGPKWQNDRDTYFILFNYGYGMPPDFEFQLTIWAGDEAAKGAEKWLDIALVSHYLFHQEERTEAFKELLGTFPEWTYVQAWTSTYESWQF